MDSPTSSSYRRWVVQELFLPTDLPADQCAALVVSPVFAIPAAKGLWTHVAFGIIAVAAIYDFVFFFIVKGSLQQNTGATVLMGPGSSTF